jgi:hypothetical protein
MSGTLRSGLASMARKSQSQQPSSRENGLTSIPSGIHCAATTNGVGGRDEIDDIAVEHFLDTLAEVALAIASRKAAQNQGGGEVEP